MTEPVANHVHNTTSGIGQALTRKIGPLPGWAWALLVVGAAYGYYWYTNRNNPASTSTDPIAALADPSTTTDTSSGDGLISSDGTVSTGTDIGTGVASPGTTTTVGSTLPDNGSWGRQGELLLAPQGTYSAGEISTALSAYLNGKTVTARQAAIINATINLIGPPPQGLLPINPVPVPTPPKPTPKPVAVVKTPAKPKPAVVEAKVEYVTRNGDTLGQLSQHYYGSPKYWHQIKVRNPKKLATKGENTKMRSGIVLTIPKKVT